MAEYIQIITTVAESADSQRIAESLLQARLAACVQMVGPVTSRYWWQGKLETATEYQCLIKTRRELYPEIEAAIRKVHPYEVPEIIAQPLCEGSVAYLQWLDGELRCTDRLEEAV